MAGFRRMRRRYRGIPVVVVLLAALAFGLTSSSADTADPASAPIANDVSAGLQSFAQSLTGLDSLNQLGQSLPFTSQVPTAADGLNYAQTFTNSLKAKLAAHPAFTSLTELEAFLSTGVSDTYGGVAVTANATVSPQTAGAPLYTIALSLHLSRAGTTPLKLDTAQVNVDGGSLTTSFDATANLSFKYDPAQAAGNKLYLDAASAPLLSTTASAQANFTTSPFDINLGFTNVHVGGTADVGGTIKAQLQDPDGNGKISQTEWTTTAPQQAFDVRSPRRTRARTSASRVISRSRWRWSARRRSPTKTPNLAKRPRPPGVSLGDLGGFKNVQPQDFMSARCVPRRADPDVRDVRSGRDRPAVPPPRPGGAVDGHADREPRRRPEAERRPDQVLRGQRLLRRGEPADAEPRPGAPRDGVERPSRAHEGDRGPWCVRARARPRLRPDLEAPDVHARAVAARSRDAERAREHGRPVEGRRPDERRHRRRAGDRRPELRLASQARRRPEPAGRGHDAQRPHLPGPERDRVLGRREDHRHARHGRPDRVPRPQPEEHPGRRRPATSGSSTVPTRRSR